MEDVEVRKLDEHGRFVVPADWRKKELKEEREVFVIKRGGYLKVIPKKRVDLTGFFDSADLGVNLDDWQTFEETFYTVE